MEDIVTYSVVITGLVQGLGFRPYLAELAEELHLGGWVKNSGGIVSVVIKGNIKAVDEWFHRLKSMPPKGARIDSIDIVEKSTVNARGIDEADMEFTIITSDSDNDTVYIAPDIATCDRCINEVESPSDRRYRYPFISCTSCGPRYSIIDRSPYDRINTRMAKYVMCPVCKKEYNERGNIRRHAQTIACYNCGPVLELYPNTTGVELIRNNHSDIDRILYDNYMIDKTIEYIRAGKIGAIKDIGGYHFACMPYNETAVRLREYKNRENKPFAIMFPDIESVKKYCIVTDTEEKLLTSAARPIVLLKGIVSFESEVCSSSDRIGAFLPCNPIQHMICKETGPLIMTSGNRGGEPIITDNSSMHRCIDEGFPDFALSHDRDIIEPLEDSIYQVTDIGDGTEVIQLIRRARGIVPEPVRLTVNFHDAVFAAGGDLKSVFAYGRGSNAYLSTCYGDIGNLDSMEQYNYARLRMADIFGIEPKIYVSDMHPEYYSTVNTGKIAAQSGNNISKNNIIRIQHHHAHIASVMAEYGLEGKVLGLAFDGTGMGDDGNIWGGEYLLCEEDRYDRIASLQHIPMPASDMTAKDPYIPAVCYIYEAYKEGLITEEELNIITGRNRYQSDIIIKAVEKQFRTTDNSSMGRLFDAVSYIIGICDYNTYEGECAVKLENAAKKIIIESGSRERLFTGNCYPDKYITEDNGLYTINSAAIIADIYKKTLNRYENTALYFHELLSDIIVTATKYICKDSIKQIALSGGTWYNQIVLKKVVCDMKSAGCKVYINEKVPSGDGGLALGQLWLAGVKRKG